MNTTSETHGIASSRENDVETWADIEARYDTTIEWEAPLPFRETEDSQDSPEAESLARVAGIRLNEWLDAQSE